MIPTQSLSESLAAEAQAMIRHLLSTGQSCPPAVVRTVERFCRAMERGEEPDIGPLVVAHTNLARQVAPGYPATIRLLVAAGSDAGGRWISLGGIPLVHQLMVVALACVAGFVSLSLFHSVGGAVDLAAGSGLALLLNELFWICAAGVGASFAMLYQVDQEIGERTFNPAHAPAYWVKLLLGIVAGFIMATLLAPELVGEEAAGASVFAGTRVLIQPLLAMLGGFSASLVYTVLNRLVESVEQLFSGSPRALIAARENAAAQRAGGEAAEERVRVAGKLVQVQQQLAAGADPDALHDSIQQVIRALVPVAADDLAGGEPHEEAEERVRAMRIVGDGAEQWAEGEMMEPAPIVAASSDGPDPAAAAPPGAFDPDRG